MKYSTTKISPAKINSSAGHALIKSPGLRKFQQKPEEACTMYFMQLRSGLIIEKKACYFKKEITRRHSLKTTRKYQKQHLVFTACAQRLNHLKRSAEDFACVIPGQAQQCATAINRSIIQGKVLFHFYASQVSTSNKGDDVDGQGLMVSLSPTKDKDFLLRANNEEFSVELQKCENPQPDQIFLLRNVPSSSECVSFECKSNPGVFIGVKGNELVLIKDEGLDKENIIFKLS
uniref:Interleukin-33 n=1 Tax=Rousettus aegyptiacus TaxID=9407 RepID=A0A7J8IKT8_ROUAE|nr:interleukin 33 [Rousettus aegyptiacus]